MMFRPTIIALGAFLTVAASAATVTVGLYAIGDTKGAPSLSPSSMTLTVDQSTSATMEQLANVSRTGYTLGSSGWRASRYASLYDAGLVFDNAWYNQNATIVVADAKPQATWKMLIVPVTPNPYTVTFSAGGGDGTMANQSFTYDVAQALTANSFTRTGHTFDRWRNNSDNRTFADGEVVSNLTGAAGGEVMLTAVWSVNSYTITLDAGEADTPGTESVQAEYGRTFPSITLPTRYGYYFKGYFTQQEGHGDQCYLENGNPCTSYLSSNATIYAKWEKIPVYNVTFLPLGGTFTNGWTTETNYMAGTSLTLPTAEDIHRDSKTFAGWYLEDDYSFTNRVYSITHLDTGNRTFKARWLGKSYTVDFQANGGVGHKTQAFEMGESQPLLSLSETQIRREGYSFREWTRAADGSGDHFADGAMIDDNLTDTDGDVVYLYAQWTNNVYAVAFQPNGADGSETMPNQAFTYDVTQNLNHVEFTYTGHAFKNWSSDTNYNYQTEYYADGEAVANLATGGVVNLYANWTGIVYTVSFDANGGAGAMDPMACTYGVPTNLPPCTFTCGSWEFQGWTTNEWTTNGVNDVHYTEGSRVSNLTATAEVTLRACWKGPVTLDARDARGDGVITNVDEAVSVTNLFVGEKWDLPGATNANPRLVFDPPNNGWCYWNAQSVMTSLPAYVQPDTTNLVVNWKWVADELAIAVDAPELEFSTFGTRGNVAEPGNSLVSAYSADWFVQSNFVHGSTNAVQSGALPENTPEGTPIGLVYVSWLTTTVKSKGVLSFWWKFDAQDEIELNGRWYGDSFKFGLFDSEKGITNTIVQLKAPADWCPVVYTNETDAAVSFAWAFAYADGLDNGGGTGWVDCVTWATNINGSATVEVTQEHKVPYSWLRENFAVDESTDFESLAEGDSPNGKPMKVWQEYWAGTNPNDPNDLFRANIAVSNDVPYITWYPDLRTNDPPRVYQVLCAPTPSASAQAWAEWPGPGDSGASTNRFFKVKLVLEEE